MSNTAEIKPGEGRARRVVFRLVMTALILFLGLRTYEETGIAVARSSGSLHTEQGTVTELVGHTKSGSSGGGQAGGATTYTYTVYTIEVRLDEGVKKLDGVSGTGVAGLETGQRVAVGLWQGRLVEIDGRTVSPGWNRNGWDLALIVLYPLIMGYLIAVVVSAVVYLDGRSGRMRISQLDRVGAVLRGLVFGMAAVVVLLGCAVAGRTLAFWPLIPLGIGLAVALRRLTNGIRRNEGPALDARTR
uniref:hypothetical protein n=1 Tax=Streptomyces chartreusis TaxID=1969 RepID=UPI003F498227